MSLPRPQRLGSTVRADHCVQGWALPMGYSSLQSGGARPGLRRRALKLGDWGHRPGPHCCQWQNPSPWFQVLISFPSHLPFTLPRRAARCLSYSGQLTRWNRPPAQLVVFTEPRQLLWFLQQIPDPSPPPGQGRGRAGTQSGACTVPGSVPAHGQHSAAAVPGSQAASSEPGSRGTAVPLLSVKKEAPRSRLVLLLFLFRGGGGGGLVATA